MSNEEFGSVVVGLLIISGFFLILGVGAMSGGPTELNPCEKAGGIWIQSGKHGPTYCVDKRAIIKLKDTP